MRERRAVDWKWAAGLVVALLTSLVVPACRDYLDLRERVRVIQETQKYLHGSIQIPKE